jgi:SET domain-containing protein
MKPQTKSVPLKVTKAHRELKCKEAINLLNDIVKIRLAPSSIHGVGVFAMRDIKKGEKLYADVIPNAFDLPFEKFKKLKPEIRDIILGHWPQVVNGSHFLYPVTKMTAFLNHSDNPNYDASGDTVLKDIKTGEEVTENYRTLKNWEKIFTWLDK